MKRLSYKIFLAFFTCVFTYTLSSCSKEEEGDYGGSITLSTYEITLPSSGGSYNVTMLSGGTISDWWASGASWIDIRYVGSDRRTVSISASPNYSSSSRAAAVVIYNTTNATQTIYVKQLGDSSGGNTGGGNTGGGNTGGGNTGGGNTGGGNTGGGSQTKPSAPSGLTATPSGPASYPYAALSWNPSSGATSYTIYRSTSANGSYSKIGTSAYTSYYDESVKYGNTYYYKVTASNSYGTSGYSAYAKCDFQDTRTPGPAQYGNCTVSGTTMTLRWSVPSDASYGKPTRALLRVRHPDTGNYVTLQTLSGSATSASFNFGMWVDSNGYVYAGIILENEYGSGGGQPKVYDTKNKRWIN